MNEFMFTVNGVVVEATSREDAEDILRDAFEAAPEILEYEISVAEVASAI